MAAIKSATVKKKTRSSTSRSSAGHKANATRKRHDLGNKLKQDLKAAREALRAANAAAREELKLANAAAKAEIAVLKDQLKAAHQREQALMKVAEQKTREMVKAGMQWEKKQMAKIRAIKPKKSSKA